MDVITEISTLEKPHPLNFIKIGQIFNFGLFGNPLKSVF